MSLDYEYVLTPQGSKQEISSFINNIKIVDEVIVYNLSLKDEALNYSYQFGMEQGVSDEGIVFDGNYQICVDDVSEISKLHPTLTFEYKYMNSNCEEVGILVVKNGVLLRDEGSDFVGKFARKLFGDDYIDDIVEYYCDEEDEEESE